MDDLILAIAILGAFLAAIEISLADETEYPTWKDIIEHIKKEREDEDK